MPHPGVTDPFDTEDVQAITRRFFDHVQMAREFIDQVRTRSTSLDRASRIAANLLLEAGVVSDIDEGIVAFHERVSQGRPPLRRILRRLDMRAGRLTVARPTTAQRATRDVLRAGMVSRDDKGRITKFSPAGLSAINRAKAVQKAIDRERIGKMQERARKRLIALGKKRGKR